jgi:2-haloacid dehalogenase
MTFRPKYVTFDCYGTLTRFRMVEMAHELMADRIPAEQRDAFARDFKCFRLDEVLGDWQPYADVIGNALERTCKLWRVPYRPEDGRAIYEAVPTWDAHADVPAGLSKVAAEIPLVILSNASDDQIHRNVAQLGAPFHAVFTAQGAQAYKPRMRPFEYMLDGLSCGPEDILHVSASLRYDLMTAHDMRITNKVYVNRGYEPSIPEYGYVEIKDIGGLPGVVGL